MMTNPTENHEQIAGKIGAPLTLAMDALGCRGDQGGMRVQRDENGHGRDKPEPDIVVRCGPRQNRTFVTDPLVIVEVLSPSTMGRDHGPKLSLYKLSFYKSLPTLRHIVLVYQDQMRVELDRREAEGWMRDVLTAPDHGLRFEAVEFEIALEQIYFDVPVLRPIAGG
ncbi:Uma2 family endonuclease [Methylobacterium currus]|uniref:Uma2 family endonuclease n=1 Tax=Methylobacterium currus TaxID=2051553 RepID=UPI001E41E0FA|nr:Uma2 family endonuclease [Methylobacterium currus]UHC18821.1 Uma2 family endonuclease [Methylobacterium currus]